MYIKPVMKKYSMNEIRQIVVRASTVCATTNFYCPSKADNCPSWDDVSCPLFGAR